MEKRVGISETHYYQVFAGNGEHKGRDCCTEDANEYGNGEIAVSTIDQGFGTTSSLQSFQSEKAHQVLRHGTTSHQTIPQGTWV